MIPNWQSRSRQRSRRKHTGAAAISAGASTTLRTTPRSTSIAHALVAMANNEWVDGVHESQIAVVQGRETSASCLIQLTAALGEELAELHQKEAFNRNFSPSR